jgi:putative Mg2+ transporter-C (MgtC) family protein
MDTIFSSIEAENAKTVVPLTEIAIRLLLASALGAIIGLDREIKRRAAGLRTHMLVSLAAAAFTIGSWELFHMVLDEARERITADPIRVIEAITAGVAFLAAGAIIRARGEVHGLTTGAGMWLAGAIGLVAGLGLYGFAVLVAILGAIVVSIIRHFEPADKNQDIEAS